ncbi:hypothetical protein F4782DRAFT_477945 [Xylaria castorea]|nr:hypothetical protein F4782DRAFT_477945 [Xylaria castorea]
MLWYKWVGITTLRTHACIFLLAQSWIVSSDVHDASGAVTALTPSLTPLTLLNRSDPSCHVSRRSGVYCVTSSVIATT